MTNAECLELLDYKKLNEHVKLNT